MIRRFFQHYLNDGHLYCRFKDLGLSPERAKRWGLAVARWLRPWLYRPAAKPDPQTF